ncbi:glycosyltransferase family 2 protein [Rufibacter roseus]|uniref:Glycosyltransferase family 2 protein n=1 Tax=Rufibacter roseus TaxID=1567108 RepID=A0ABW2DJ26_9BACT|nr:glycosyltransferase [Rufibacter roseus]
MNEPLVTIICLCYNHAKFLQEALDSVLAQTYSNLEVIVVDDASSDASAQVISEYVRRHPHIQFIQHHKNRGNCASFNEAFGQSRGEYIIDFATDDVLYPERVKEQVCAFQTLPQDYGVVYTDADLINEKSIFLRHFYQRSASGELVPEPAEGEVFAHVLSRYFICPPTMMIRRQVLEELNGYDLALAYEDFDFWVRSSRSWRYHYLDKVLCKRRVHIASLSQQVYKKGDRQLQSTIQVIQKAQKLVRTSVEKLALVKRVKYEARHAYFTSNYPEALQLLEILEEETSADAESRVMRWLAKKRVPLQFLRRWYHGWRYRHTSA